MLVAVVLLFSIIQSLFGMGLLLFGTPTLILLGVSFTEALSVLLPPSLTISIIQVVSFKQQDKKFIFSLSLYCLPVVAAALTLVSLTGESISIDLVLAIMLLFGVIIRLSETLQTQIRLCFNQFSPAYFALMGGVHGFSNMGGSLLSLYAGSCYNSKLDTLRCVATGYLLFGIVQVGALYVLGNLHLDLFTLLYCCVAGLAYWSLGNRLFSALTNHHYQSLFTGFMLVYAGILLWKYLS